MENGHLKVSYKCGEMWATLSNVNTFEGILRIIESERDHDLGRVFESVAVALQYSESQRSLIITLDCSFALYSIGMREREAIVRSDHWYAHVRKLAMKQDHLEPAVQLFVVVMYSGHFVASLKPSAPAPCKSTYPSWLLRNNIPPRSVDSFALLP